MTGDDFLELADQLLVQAPSEAGCRTAISRAYYGAFHLTQAFLISLGGSRRKHGEVWNDLGSTGVPVAKQLATKLAILHENRTVADYRLDSAKPRNLAFVQDNLARAKEIRTLVTACEQEPTKTQIKEALARDKRVN